MNTKKHQSRPLILFYGLFVYVLIQFIWWSYLMIQLNNEVRDLKNELNLFKGDTASEIMVTGNQLNEKLHKRWIMIASEGAVFISLLALGIIQTRRAFKKEEELNNRQHNFLLSITHELKSPIASTKLQLQTLLKRDTLTKEIQKEIITNALSENERLNNLVENILLASKIENNAYALNKEQYNLSEYITEGMSQTINLFNYKQKVVLAIEPDIYMPIDKINFPSIILNLFENAVKYSPDDSTITIGLKKKGTIIILSVTDEGIGIPDNEKTVIFQKFYRIGNEETRNNKGTGLGLYIVNYLVEQHNGRIVIKDNLPKGSIFEIKFNA